jgi:hypothetical protein
MIVSSAKFCLESKRNADAQVFEFRMSEQVVPSSVSRFGVQRRVTCFKVLTRPRASNLVRPRWQLARDLMFRNLR